MTSPPPPDRAAALGKAQTLANALDGMAKQLKTVNDNSEERDAELKKYGRRNRLGLVLDVGLTIVIALLAWQNSSTSGRVSSADARSAASIAEANATRMSSISACQSTNVARAENEQLWRYVIGLLAIPHPDETAAQEANGEKVVAELKARVSGTFAPRNCMELVNGRH